MSQTPGQWTIRYDSHGAEIKGPHNEGVAWCGDNYSTETGRVPFRANARLIAAAPDLLAACENNLKWMHFFLDYADKHEVDFCGYMDGFKLSIADAEAAIKKAMGES